MIQIAISNVFVLVPSSFGIMFCPNATDVNRLSLLLFLYTSSCMCYCTRFAILFVFIHNRINRCDLSPNISHTTVRHSLFTRFYTYLHGHTMQLRSVSPEFTVIKFERNRVINSLEYLQQGAWVLYAISLAKVPRAC